MEGIESVSEEIVIITFLNNDDSSLEPLGDLGSSNESSLALELLPEVASLVCSLLSSLCNNEELRLLSLHSGVGFDHLLLCIIIRYLRTN